jgi:copper chaperone CopZ
MNMLLTTTKTGSTRPVTLPLYNLRCSSDAQTVERVLRREQGVATVYANPATEKVYIEYDAALTNRDRLRALLQEAGFGPKPAHVTCGHCR